MVLREIVQKYHPSTKPYIGQPRCDPCGSFNGILYVLTTRCSWLDVPAKNGTKSMGPSASPRVLEELAIQLETKDQEHYPGQPGFRKYSKRRRPFWFNPELYKKRSAVERLFSGIEAFKKAIPR